MKNIKRIIAIVVAFIFFYLGVKFWDYILINDSVSYTRIMMHEMYNAAENIDIIFVGSSHVYRSFVPKITDKAFGAYTFNVGSSSQAMDGSSTIIKEVAKNNKLKHVYLEFYYDVVSGMDYKERTALTYTYILSDYMPMSLNKINYITHASSDKYWINSFFKAKRNWKKFFDSNYVKDVISVKQTEQYKSYEYPNADGATEYYVERGFVANDGEMSKEKYFNVTAYGEINKDSIPSKDSDWYKSVLEIVDYCKKNDIELTFFVTLEPEWTLVGKENYQEYHDYIANIARDNNIEFYDFNLCRNNYFDTNDRSLFKDEHHLNTKGAEKFSVLFADVVTGRLESEEVLFKSFTDKIKEEDIPFYGIAGPINDGNGDRKCKIVSGSDHFNYQVIETREDGTKTVLKEYDGTRDFTIPADDTGVLSVIYEDLYSKEVYTKEVEF